MVLYQGSIMGFNYNIELENDAEFEIWLTEKLKQYYLKEEALATKVWLRLLKTALTKV